MYKNWLNDLFASYLLHVLHEEALEVPFPAALVVAVAPVEHAFAFLTFILYQWTEISHGITHDDMAAIL
jgi:hypothetical protein